MPTLDDLRAASEERLNTKLDRLDERHKKRLRSLLSRYGSVDAIPETEWWSIRHEIEEETAAAILLLILAADDWTTGQIEGQDVETRRRTKRITDLYSLEAGRRAIDMAAQTTDTVRARLKRKLEDARTSGPGAVGELTEEGIDEALEDTYTPERRGTIATDQTTSGFSLGQRGAAERGDGAETADGQKVRIELRWVTERDNRVCPRCSPLEGTYEDVWGLVFPEGPGSAAHPNCRCYLDPVAIVTAED